MKRVLRKILTMVMCAALVAPATFAQRRTSAAAAAQKNNPAPKLVVIIVVDQMRADYFERYGHQWTKGLRRLMEQGAWFRQAAYPYMNTITCAGHSTISTGSFPATHGIVLNAWWDRESAKPVNCTEDPKAQTISYGTAVKGGHSAVRLEAPTLADELRTQSGGKTRVVTMAVKARAAIMLAGHRADAATWFHFGNGAWVTTSAFASAPVAFVENFIKSHPVERDLGKTWARALPESAYLFEDAAPEEKPQSGWADTFPHPLNGEAEPAMGGQSQRPTATFYRLWSESPFGDAYVGEMAAAAVDALRLGNGPATDYLALSFDSLDSIGHAFGPQSHEVQDVLVRLDATLGTLLSHLDHAVGEKNYLVALSADHGVAPIPERMLREGFDAGRVSTTEVSARVERALEPFLGTGKHVAQMMYTDLYFMPGDYARLQANPAAIRAANEAIRSVPGVWKVFRSEELLDAKGSGDASVRAAALSYFPGRSGDMIVLPRPYWFFVTDAKSVPAGSATTHGTSHGYDQHVPVILMGHGIKSGEYLNAATPADIAPTLAVLCGITLTHTDGRVLAEALQASRPRGGQTAPPADAAKKP